MDETRRNLEEVGYQYDNSERLTALNLILERNTLFI